MKKEALSNLQTNQILINAKLSESICTTLSFQQQIHNPLFQCIKKSISTTIQYENQWEEERKNIINLLLSSQSISKNKIDEMINYISNIPEQSRLSFLKLHSDPHDKIGIILNHYLGAWLLSMGYKTSKNKKYVLGKVYLLSGRQNLKQASYLYQSMFSDLDKSERIEQIWQVCKNGWMLKGEVNLKSHKIIQFHSKT